MKSECEKCGDCVWECPRCRELRCAGCGDQGYGFRIRGEDYCAECSETILDEQKDRIAAHAARLEITGDLKEYDPEQHHAPTREEYELGYRYAHTVNAVRAANRHEHTNYDEVIKGLDRECLLDTAIYEAVQTRLAELLPDHDYPGYSE
jgi:hypothetical protein